ncbi:Amidophosphoribosyltransferase [Toxocara canis]|uniref:Amidophosphoribosyltransferase n=1 Tax=Toxocara canis TaxID=6265 RepID=A0A0B2UTS8_TOXCA|nr:Amidophosphoribosyltransferase [Toxocara canis]
MTPDTNFGFQCGFGPAMESLQLEKEPWLQHQTTFRNAKPILIFQSDEAVHLRIASPPVKYPCFMGINIPSTKELIAANRSVDEISEEFGADSVRYLSIEGLQRAVVSGIKRQPNSEIGHCMACLTGQYPIDLDW